MFSEDSSKLYSSLSSRNFSLIFKQTYIYSFKITQLLHDTIQCSREEVISLISFLLTCRPYACMPKPGSLVKAAALITDPEVLEYCLIPSCNYIKLNYSKKGVIKDTYYYNKIMISL